MPHHSAYGLNVEDLDILVVEDSRPMQAVIRSILWALHPMRVRVFDEGDSALESMVSEPPNLIISDWKMEPMSGLQLLRTVRNVNMAPICYVPFILATAYATRDLTQRALLLGAHQVLVKPLSPNLMIERIKFILRDPRPFEEEQDGRVMISGVKEQLYAHEARARRMQNARAHLSDAKQRQKAPTPEPTAAPASLPSPELVQTAAQIIPALEIIQRKQMASKRAAFAPIKGTETTP